MNGFKKLIKQRNELIFRAKYHYERILFSRVINRWQLSIRESLDQKYRIADVFNRVRMLKTYFNGMKFSKQCVQIAAAKAGRFYKYKMKTKLFETWRIYSLQEKEKAATYELLIEEHNESRVLTKYLKIWKEFPAETKRQRQRQKRIDELRNKVKQMIPDYEGPILN